MDRVVTLGPKRNHGFPTWIASVPEYRLQMIVLWHRPKGRGILHSPPGTQAVEIHARVSTRTPGEARQKREKGRAKCGWWVVARRCTRSGGGKPPDRAGWFPASEGLPHCLASIV